MRNRFISRLTTVVIVGSTLACVEGTSNGSMGTAPTGGVQVRLINAIAPSQTLDFVVDGQVARSGVVYGASSPYTSMSVGSHQLQARSTTTGTTLVDFTRELTAAGSFSLIPAPGLAQFGALFITDDPTPVAGQARVRAVHVAAAAPTAVTVFLMPATSDPATATPTIPTLVFATASGYVQVPPGTYRVRVTRAVAPNDLVVDLGNLTFGAGTVRSLLVTDAPTGGLPTNLSVVTDGF